MSPKAIAEQKQHLRESMLALRQGLSPDEVQEAGRAVACYILDNAVTRQARNICLYASTGKEIPTWDLLSRLKEDGKVISVPDWEGWKQGSGIRLVNINGSEDLMTEGRVVPQPRVTGEAIISPDEIDLFIIPGVAFDRLGNRLGMGGGYFDRLLALASAKSTLFGLAYPFQVMARLPSEPHDIPVHDVVTPGSWQFCRVIQ